MNEHEHIATIAPTITYCQGCESTLAPDGRCMNVGACIEAGNHAAKGAARETAKYAVPAAWNARGSVD